MYVPQCILITGACGFIGGAVFRLLRSKYPEYKLICLDSLEYCSNQLNLPKLDDKTIFVYGDICDSKLIDYLIQFHNIDTIVNFAAESHVDNSFNNSIAFTKTNIIGTHTLLQASLNHKDKIKRFIHVSTDEVYGETIGEDSVREDSILNPTNPYAATKAGAEFLVRSYMHSFHLPCIITRGNNVYGPRQFTEKVIPKFISRLLRGMKMELHGAGNSMRSFMYIDDVANAFDIIIHKGKHGIYNIGSPNEYSIKDIANRLSKIICPEVVDCITYVQDRAFNDVRYYISCDALIELGWTQQIDINEGLEKTVRWFLENVDFWKSKEQIVEISLNAHPGVNK